MRRRAFIQAGVATTVLGGLSAYGAKGAPTLRISLAQWSLHRRFFGKSLEAGFGQLFGTLMSDPDSALQGEDPLNYPQIAREEFGLDAVEYVNTFYLSRAGDEAYLGELAQRASDSGVSSRLIMCDLLGSLGAPDATERAEAIESHRPWLSAAEQLGCHAIRVNLYGEGGADEMAERTTESLGVLGEMAASHGLNVLVENHGGLSSNAAWLAGVMRSVNRSNVGTLPDFGNFRLLPNSTPRQADDPQYDRYQGVAELMPFAKAVSAKSYAFDASGDETTIDYERMMNIVREADYSGDIGIEYEGRTLSEGEGILATRKLLERFV